MAKIKLKDVKKQIKRQEEDVYGDTTFSGSAPDPESDDDIEEVVKKVIGHKPKRTYAIEKEVGEAEKARRGVTPHKNKK